MSKLRRALSAHRRNRILRQYQRRAGEWFGLPTFAPSSANFDLHPELAFSAANNFPAQLLRLGWTSTVQEKSLDDFPETSASERLGRLFIHYGSDKREHGYHRLYAGLFAERQIRRLFEIGIGSQAPGTVSSMGPNYQPGGSLRSYSDFLPSARIIGADIDPSIMFSDERIETCVVDQMQPTTLSIAFQKYGPFEVIIDDGLHSTEANLNTLSASLEAIEPGGLIVIEDIPLRTLDAWRCAAHFLPDYRCHLVCCEGAWAFVAEAPSMAGRR